MRAETKRSQWKIWSSRKEAKSWPGIWQWGWELWRPCQKLATDVKPPGNKVAGQANWAEKETESFTVPFPSPSVPMLLLFLARLIPSPPFASLVLITESSTTRLELFLTITLVETILLPLLVVAEHVLCLWWGLQWMNMNKKCRYDKMSAVSHYLGLNVTWLSTWVQFLTY